MQSINEMAIKRVVTFIHESFRFPAIRFDAPTLLSFSGYTYAHAKCPPVVHLCIGVGRYHLLSFSRCFRAPFV